MNYQREFCQKKHFSFFSSLSSSPFIHLFFFFILLSITKYSRPVLQSPDLQHHSLWLNLARDRGFERITNFKGEKQWQIRWRHQDSLKLPLNLIIEREEFSWAAHSEDRNHFLNFRKLTRCALLTVPLYIHACRGRLSHQY